MSLKDKAEKTWEEIQEEKRKREEERKRKIEEYQRQIDENDAKRAVIEEKLAKLRKLNTELIESHDELYSCNEGINTDIYYLQDDYGENSFFKGAQERKTEELLAELYLEKMPETLMKIVAYEDEVIEKILELEEEKKQYSNTILKFKQLLAWL